MGRETETRIVGVQARLDCASTPPAPALNAHDRAGLLKRELLFENLKSASSARAQIPFI